MKRTCRVLLCLLLVLMLLPVGLPVRGESNEELKQAILESCIYNEKIDISAFHVTLEELNDLFYAMVDVGELPWYTERKYFNYEYDEDTMQALSFAPKLLPASRYDRAVYQQRLEEVLQECVIEGMADWQIALAVHDWLILHAAYDESLNETTGYELLVDGKTVCAGYTEVYREVLNMAGIPCISVVSEPMRHTWNLVQIGGAWYHVDVTWDDPTTDVYGRACHAFFLLSDAQISAGDDPHYDWVTDIQCTDESYTDAFWRDVDSGICFTDPDTCYLIRDKKFQNTIYKRDISSGKETAVYKEKKSYINIGKGNYSYRHNGLSLWNGRLWFGTLDKVMSMNTDGTDVRTEFTYEAKKYKRFLAGTYVYQDTIRYTTMEHTGYPERRVEELEPSGYHVHDYTQTVVAPTCETTGYTESACSCGITCQSTPTQKLGHDWQPTEDIVPTLFAEGAAREQCTGCGQVITQILPKLTLTQWLLENILPVAVIAGGIVGALVATVLVITRKKKTTV